MHWRGIMGFDREFCCNIAKSPMGRMADLPPTLRCESFMVHCFSFVMKLPSGVSINEDYSMY